MIDPVDTLAFAMHARKGSYAVLLGSGISSAAGILTGWQITLDLVSRLAAVENEEVGNDPAGWYARKYGVEPDYANLLEHLAPTPTERQLILRRYFEPDPDEREQGLKTPTAAHREIASLAATGHLRVIITTNFDHLLEQALQEAGVHPTVISNDDALQGAVPLQHSDCTIVKVNGDYLDVRIKNTPAELAAYSPHLVRLLDRIFDEYGLIVCGWSADYDTALRNTMLHAPGRRFGTYWIIRSDLGEYARQLVAHRDAVEVRRSSADTFFRELAEKIAALEAIDRAHPLSIKMAVATLKRYLREPAAEIRLHDLVMAETESLYSKMAEEMQPRPLTAESLVETLTYYEALTERLQKLIITGAYWAQDWNTQMWVNCLERLSSPPGWVPTGVIWQNLKRYPALIALYSGGISALASGRIRFLNKILTEPKISDYGQEEEQPALRVINTARILPDERGKLLPAKGHLAYPFSDYLSEALREPFKDLIPEDTRFDRLFDKFEYLLALVHAHVMPETHLGPWGPIGIYVWRDRRRRGTPVLNEVAADLTMNERSTLLQAGLFDGDHDRAMYVMTKLNELLDEAEKRIQY